MATVREETEHQVEIMLAPVIEAQAEHERWSILQAFLTVSARLAHRYVPRNIVAEELRELLEHVESGRQL